MDLSLAAFPYGGRPMYKVTTYLVPLPYPDPDYYKLYDGKYKNHDQPF